MKTKIYIHIAVMRNFNKILTRLLNKINSSGLYKKADEINLNVCGDYTLLDIKKMPKYNITNETQSTKKCEFPTLDAIWEDAQTEKFKVLYLHTKGVTRDSTKSHVQDWVDYMSYFNIEKWRDRLSDLKKYDLSGANYIKNPISPKSPAVALTIECLKRYDKYKYADACHYSGNFWWGNSCHIKGLLKPSSLVQDSAYLKYRHIAEMWIGGNSPNAYCAWRSKINHYKKEYPRDKYELGE